MHLHGHLHFTQVLHQVVRERIVVIDDQNHDMCRARLSPFREISSRTEAASLCLAPTPRRVSIHQPCAPVRYHQAHIRCWEYLPQRGLPRRKNKPLPLAACTRRCARIAARTASSHLSLMEDTAPVCRSPVPLSAFSWTATI